MPTWPPSRRRSSLRIGRDTIEVRSTLDGNVRNCWWSGTATWPAITCRWLEKRALSENSVIMTVETTQSQIPVALAARTSLWHDDTPAPATYRLVDNEFEIGHDIFTELRRGSVAERREGRHPGHRP